METKFNVKINKNLSDEEAAIRFFIDIWCRHLYCRVFGDGRKSSHKRSGAYATGFCYCSACSVYWKLEDCPAFLCPCCNIRIRIRRRDREGREQRNTKRM